MATREILEIGAEGGTDKAVEIDVIYSGKPLKIGDKLDPTIVLAYEVKTSASGYIDPNQRAKYLMLFGDDSRLVTSRYRAARSGALVMNADFEKRMKLMQAGVAAFAFLGTYNWLTCGGEAQAYQELLNDRRLIENHQRNINELFLQRISLIEHYFAYMDNATFGQFDEATTLVKLKSIYDTIMNFGNPD